MRKLDCLAGLSPREVGWVPAAAEHEMALFSAPRQTESTHRKQQILVHLRGRVHAELTEGPCDGSTGWRRLLGRSVFGTQRRNLSGTAEQATVPICSGSRVLHGGDTLLSRTPVREVEGHQDRGRAVSLLSKKIRRIQGTMVTH